MDGKGTLVIHPRLAGTNIIGSREAGGSVTHVEGFVCDIRERKLTEEALRESGKRMARIIDFLPNAMMAIDMEGRVIAWNHAMAELSGVGAKEIMGRGNYEYALPFYGKRRPFLADLVIKPDATYRKEYDIIKRENHNIIAEMKVRRESGEVQFLWGKAGPIFDSHGNVVGAIESIRDVTARKRAEKELMSSHEELELRVSQRTSELSAMPEELWERSLEPVQRLAITIAEHLGLALTNLKLRETLHHQSIVDPLTGLYNRRHMAEALEREAARALRHKTELGVIMLDVDHFRNFNDTYGHDCGDEVLRELGAYLRSKVRREDIACRYGGEEFALIMTETSMAATLKKAEKLCSGIRENISVRHRDEELGITVSLGASIFPGHGEAVWDVVKAADEALYRAKAQGRNRAVAAARPS